MNKIINFSFIIPHKNIPDLLQKCLDSIPRRDDVQIIVVDDNSDTDKVDFSNFPGLNDPTVEVYLTKEGKGAGYARNVGLQHAVGRWIVFADADDYFTVELEEALKEYKDLIFDVVFFKNKSIKIPSGEPSYRGNELNRRVSIALKNGDYTLPLLYSSPWQKFFSHSFLIQHNIKFNEVRYANDVVFMAKVASAANSFAASDYSIYCITESSLSLIKTTDINAKIMRFSQECECVQIIRTTQYKNEPSLYYWHFMTWFDVWKISHKQAISLISKAYNAAGFKFFLECFKTKFIR